MIELIIQYFKVNRIESDKNYNLLCKRQSEYTYCLKQNLKYTAINKIHVLLEDDIGLEEMKKEGINVDDKKLIIYKLGKRMLFKDAFEYANKKLSGKIVIILHTDIYLVSGFENIKTTNLKNKMYALARTNNVDGKNTGRGIKIKKIPNKKGDYCVSFDGFSFLSPLPEKLINEANHQQNIWGAENRLVYIFKKHNYDVITPNILKMVHWHMTDIRPWQQNWITKDGQLIPHNNGEFYRKYQKNNPNIVGGLIPIEMGTSLMTNYL